jgi:Rieske Fe-S protein
VVWAVLRVLPDPHRRGVDVGRGLMVTASRARSDRRQLIIAGARHQPRTDCGIAGSVGNEDLVCGADISQTAPSERGPLGRRAVLSAGGAVGACGALLALAGCAIYSNQQGPTPRANLDQTQRGSAENPVGSAASTPTATEPTASGTALGPTSAVPVGGGTVFPEASVVITQPTAGSFHAFSAICTHQGCTVSEVSKGTINCPCHGSQFKIIDGSVADGPATRPLAAKQLSTAGGQLRVG